MNIQQAVALLYPDDKDATIIMAKEKAVLAQKMIDIAKRIIVPICTTNYLVPYFIYDFIHTACFISQDMILTLVDTDNSY